LGEVLGRTEYLNEKDRGKDGDPENGYLNEREWRS